MFLVHTAALSYYNALPHLVQASCEKIQLIDNFNQKFSSRLTSRKVDMGLADTFGRKRVLRVNVDLQGPARYQSPELRAITVAFFECHQVLIGEPGSMKHGRVSGAHKVWETQGTHVGRSSLTFFSVSLSRSTGSTRPDAFPKDTMVPLRLIILKSSSNLQQSVRDVPALRRCSRCSPYTVVDHVHSFAIRELEHAFDYVLLFV